MVDGFFERMFRDPLFGRTRFGVAGEATYIGEQDRHLLARAAQPHRFRRAQRAIDDRRSEIATEERPLALLRFLLAAARLFHQRDIGAVVDDEDETDPHAIFADGAGAVALAGDGDGPTIVEHRTLFRPEHLDAMGFEYPGGRPRVVLSKEVRRIGAGMMREMADILMTSHGLKRDDVRHFVLHSAGRRVIEQARTLLGLTDAQLAHSRHVLRVYGNMSSATVLFVLEEALKSGAPQPGDWGLMIALGPGFAAEGALLRW